MPWSELPEVQLQQSLHNTWQLCCIHKLPCAQRTLCAGGQVGGEAHARKADNREVNAFADKALHNAARTVDEAAVRADVARQHHLGARLQLHHLLRLWRTMHPRHQCLATACMIFSNMQLICCMCRVWLVSHSAPLPASSMAHHACIFSAACAL